MSELGLKLSEHRVRRSWALNNFAGAAVGIGSVVAVLRWVEHVNLHGAFAALTVLIAAAYFFAAGCRALKLTVTLHERGIVIGETPVKWSDVLRGELRYVPGLFKKGLSSEKNCVSLVVVSQGARHSIPSELEGFEAVVERVRAMGSFGVERVLVKTLLDA